MISDCPLLGITVASPAGVLPRPERAPPCRAGACAVFCTSAHARLRHPARFLLRGFADQGLRGGKVPRAWVVEKSGSVAAPRRIFGPSRSILAESRTRTFTGRVRRASGSRTARDGASTRPAARPRCRTPRDRPLCAGRDAMRIRAAGKAGISSAAGTQPTGCWPAWARPRAARSRLPARAQRRPRGRARPRRDCARAGNPGRRPRCSAPCAGPRA